MMPPVIVHGRGGGILKVNAVALAVAHIHTQDISVGIDDPAGVAPGIPVLIGHQRRHVAVIKLRGPHLEFNSECRHGIEIIEDVPAPTILTDVFQADSFQVGGRRYNL